jgi:uncharacterized protein YjbI with pentapeptide repeats
MGVIELLVLDAGGGATPVGDGLLSSIEPGDVRRRRLTGQPSPGQAFHNNVVESRLENIDFLSIDFSRCDWKDCRFDDVVYVDCDMSNATFLTNAYSRCRFIRCRFGDTGVSDCTFMECVFEDCDLKSIIVKSSRFEACEFIACDTSNRIIESSLLIHTLWRDMRLEIALVTGNFGLQRSQLLDCDLVYRIKSETPQSVATDLVSLDLNPIERFRYAYFETGLIDEDPAALEAALFLPSWTREAVVHASFGGQLSDLCQFLLKLYEDGDAPTYPLLILHTRNFELLEWLGERPDMRALYQVVAGVHLLLTREVDAYVAQLSALNLAIADRREVHFAAEGPLDVGYFQTWIEDRAGLRGAKVVSVRPRNSPIDLGVLFADNSALVAALALFLACRTKFELTDISGRTAGRGTGRARPDRSLVAFSAGFSKTRPSEYELNVQTILPRSLLLDLQLSMNVAVFQRVRAVLVDILIPAAGAPGSERERLPKAGPTSQRSRRE